MLPNGEKIFERIYTENNLISHDQLGFKSGDLCINQLLSITHEINYADHLMMVLMFVVHF